MEEYGEGVDKQVWRQPTTYWQVFLIQVLSEPGIGSSPVMVQWVPINNLCIAFNLLVYPFPMLPHW